MESRIILTLILVLAISPASAKFICGEVETLDETSPSWFEVIAQPKENQTISTNCKVSPEDNKYCCDIEALKDIFNYSWEPGEIFQTSIADNSSGYFSPKQEITLTSQGYDISPKLTLKKAIKENPKIPNLIISDKSEEFQIIISEECSGNSKIITPNKGENKIFSQAICNNKTFNIEKTLYFLDKAEAKKSTTQFKSEETITITINLELSNEIKNLKLTEYIPSNFQIISAKEAKISKSTKDYNKIEWQVSGKKISLEYKIKAPKVSIGKNSYETITELESEIISKEILQVKKLIPIPNSKSQTSNYKFTPTTFSKVSSEYPILTYNEELTAALYSNESKESEAFEIEEFNSPFKINRSYIYLKSFQVKTTLPQEEQKIFKLEYEISNEEYKKEDWKNIVFFTKKGNEIIKIPSTSIPGKNEQAIIFSLESEPLDNFHIFAEKKHLSLWDKIIIFFSKLI
jgi:hypothetical protein